MLLCAVAVFETAWADIAHAAKVVVVAKRRSLILMQVLLPILLILRLQSERSACRLLRAKHTAGHVDAEAS